MGATVTSFLTSMNVFSCSSVHCHSVSLLVSRCKGSITSAKPGRNFARYLTNMLILCMPSTSSGFGMSCTAFAFSGSIFTPCGVSTCPINGTSRFSYSLSLLRAMLRSRHRCSKASRFLLWSAVASSSLFLTPYTRMSSAISSAPFKPSSAWWTLFWKISDETDKPKGNRRQRYLPNSV